MTDPISDMLTRIRNALAVRKETVIIPYSKIKANILDLLVREGYLAGAKRVGRRLNKFIEVELKYNEKKEPVIREIEKISKASQRVYWSVKQLPSHRYGLYILTTPKGIMTHWEAKKNHLGGEVLLRVF